ncbi:hypothetical protein KIH79_08940, partial [Bifidobacterium sp. 82T10]|nr:hypothetical protein [Bifidobacterium miconis]
LHGECIARFMCAYRPGVIEAVAYDATGHDIGRDRLHSATDHTELRAEVEWPIAAAGDADVCGPATVRPGRLAFVRVRYTDEHGITKPLERGTLRANVTGGDLLGFGCAAPFNRGSFVTGETGTYYGEALAVVRMPADAIAGHVAELTVSDGTHVATCGIIAA